MKRTVVSIYIFLALCLCTWAQTGTITNISIQPHTDGSGMIDVNFILSGEADSYNILMEVSFDAGNTYTPIPKDYLSGDLQGVSPGSKNVVWDGYGSFPDEFSAQTRIKIVATAGGGNNGEPGQGVTDIDGNFYPSVIIGNQEWMAENLKTTKYRNGTHIVYPGTDNTDWQNNTTGAYAWYNNDIAWKDSYGALYKWHAVNNSNGLCPTGWHVPSDAEWSELVDYLVAQGYPNEWDNPNGAGNALKSCRQVSSPLGGDCDTSEHPRWNSHSTHYGTDEFGFSVLPGGLRWGDGDYDFVGNLGAWWSSTENETSSAWNRRLYNENGNVARFHDSKLFFFSVRCVRDMDNGDTTAYTLTLQVSPESSGQVSGEGEYAEGATFKITATPNYDYQFVNWTGDTDHVANASAAITTLTMPAMDVNLTANYETRGGNIQTGTGVTDIDGNFYPSVIIGNQEWMAENLKSTKYRNGTPIEYPGTDNNAWAYNTTGAYAWYDNDIAWKDSYGALYNGHAVNNSNGLCPTGWHVPSDADWTELVDYVVAQGYPNSNVVNSAGYALKSCRQVSSLLGGDCATSQHPRWNAHTTDYGIDEFGFSALPGGDRGTFGPYDDLGDIGFWWSSSESARERLWSRTLFSNSGVSRHDWFKELGFSVRCVRDE